MKWFGTIACMETVETEKDVFEEKPVERQYMGDVIKQSKSNQTNSTINQNMTLGNELSVIYDPYLQTHFYRIAYATFMGAKWRISNVTIQGPRMILTFGDLYKEDEANEEQG